MILTVSKMVVLVYQPNGSLFASGHLWCTGVLGSKLTKKTTNPQTVFLFSPK